MTQRALDVDVIKQYGGQQTAARRVQVKRARASSSPRSKRRAEGRLRSGGRWVYGEAQVRCTREGLGCAVAHTGPCVVRQIFGFCDRGPPHT